MSKNNSVSEPTCLRQGLETMDKDGQIPKGVRVERHRPQDGIVKLGCEACQAWRLAERANRRNFYPTESSLGVAVVAKFCITPENL